MIKDEALIRAPKINLQWLLLTFKERANRAAIGKTESYFVSLIYACTIAKKLATPNIHRKNIVI